LEKKQKTKIFLLRMNLLIEPFRSTYENILLDRIF